MPGKTILVTGATGAQGGGVASHLLSSGRYTVRCLTRKPQSEKAAALRSAGAEIVPGDFEDPSSLEAAMKGCYGVFGVTNYWEAFDREVPQGRNLVDAVAASGIEHFIFSSLPSAKKLTHGQLDVPHIETKAIIEEYARSLGLPATYVHVAFYCENFLTYFPPRRIADGSFVFAFPQGDAPLATVAVDDVGGVVTALFDREADKGRVLAIAGDEQPCQDYAATMSRITGQRIAYQHVPREAFAARRGPRQHVRVLPPLRSQPPRGDRGVPNAVPWHQDLRSVAGREPGALSRRPLGERRRRCLTPPAQPDTETNS